MRKFIRSLALGVAALSLVATAASAAVTINTDPESADYLTGFVGKGDVQLAFGWNNKQLQANAQDVSFEWEQGETVEQDCASNDRGTFTTVGKRTKTEGIEAELSGDPRQVKGQNQFTGFILSGPAGTGVTYSDGQWVGEDGDTTGNACPSGSSPHGAPRVLSSSAGTLYAVYHGVRVAIYSESV